RFEPALTASYTHARSDVPPRTLQEGAAGELLTFVEDDWRLGLAKQFQTGTRLELDFTNARARSSAGTGVQPLAYRSTLALSITQPLLRGFSTDLVLPRIELLTARIASEHERQQLLVTAAEVIERTEDAYWDVVQALYRYDLDLRSQKRAAD